MTTATLTNIVIPNLGFQRLAARLITRLGEYTKQAKRRDMEKVRPYSFVGENLLDPNLGHEIRRIQR